MLKNEKINVNFFNVLWLKPFKIKQNWIRSINNSKKSHLFLMMIIEMVFRVL